MSAPLASLPSLPAAVNAATAATVGDPADPTATGAPALPPNFADQLRSAVDSDDDTRSSRPATRPGQPAHGDRDPLEVSAADPSAELVATLAPVAATPLISVTAAVSVGASQAQPIDSKAMTNEVSATGEAASSPSLALTTAVALPASGVPSPTSATSTPGMVAPGMVAPGMVAVGRALANPTSSPLAAATSSPTLAALQSSSPAFPLPQGQPPARASVIGQAAAPGDVEASSSEQAESPITNRLSGQGLRTASEAPPAATATATQDFVLSLSTPATPPVAPVAAAAPIAPAAAPVQSDDPPQAQIYAVLAPLRGSTGERQLVVHLHPAELGPVTVIARTDHDMINVELSSANQGAHDALSNALPGLRDDLHDAGFGSVSVQLGMGSASPDGREAGADRRPPATSASPSPTSSAAASGPERARPNGAAGRGRDSALDRLL